jgi:hypothetical protein
VVSASHCVAEKHDRRSIASTAHGMVAAVQVDKSVEKNSESSSLPEEPAMR